MSRRRSESPVYRSFPWAEPDFDHQLDRNPPEDFREYFREEELYSGGPRRPPPPGRPPFRGPHHLGPVDLHPQLKERFSHLQWDGGRGVEQGRGFRPHFPHFNHRGRSSRSPTRLPREQLPHAAPPHRGKEQGRGRGQFRELSPRGRLEEEGGRRNTQRPPPPLLHHDRSPPFKRHRADSDENHHPGFRAQEEFWGQGYSVGSPRGGFGGNAREDLPPRDGLPHRDDFPPRDNPPRSEELPLRDDFRLKDDWPRRGNHPRRDNHPPRDDHPRRDNHLPRDNHPRRVDHSPRDDHPRRDNHLPRDDHPPRNNHAPRDNHPRRDDYLPRDGQQSGPIIVDHGHRAGSGREPPQWEGFSGDRKAGPDGPAYKQRSQEQFRHDSREHRFQDLRGPRRSPPPQQDRSPMRFENRSGPLNHRQSGASHQMRDHYSHNRGAKAGLPQTQTRFLQASQRYQEVPEETHRGGYPPLREAHTDPLLEDDTWVELDRHQDSDHKMTHQRPRVWKHSKKENTAVATEETLTIKVDMSRPAQHNSAPSYSADRQLSLDLVHVGRQRLDFLPMLEHSGTFQESSIHSGTFAQEIITLVHQVKDQYFRGESLTLDQRFSAPPNISCSEEEAQELTLDRRFSSNRGFSLNMSSLLDEDEDDEEPFFSMLHVQGLSQPPVRGPGDLRHDLERRRQEKLEGVKVTIPGSSGAQRPPAAAKQQYSRMQDRTGPRREAAPHGPAPPRNQRFTSRRPNFHCGSTGSDR